MILSIETATNLCSVALHNETQEIGSMRFDLQKSHASLLPTIIQDLLKNTQINKEEIKAIAVSSGPGSYTGLRIGVSVAKGLCYALNIPLISVPTLHILLQQVMDYNHFDAYICPMLDARRMEVYTFIADMNGNILENEMALILEKDYFLKYDDKPLIIIGDGAKKCKNFLQHHHLIINENILPDARYMKKYAFEKFLINAFEKLHTFEPNYLKPFYTTAKKT